MLEISFYSFLVAGTFFDAAYFDLFYQLVAIIVVLKTQAENTSPLPSSVSGTEAMVQPRQGREVFVPS